MNVIGKTLKTAFWTLLLLSPAYFIGTKAIPMITDAIETTHKVRAENDQRRKEELDAIATDLSAASDPNLAADGTVAEDMEGSASAQASVASTSADLGEKTDQAQKRPSAKTQSKTTIIEITNANMNDFWDPAAEERVKNMAISEELKRQILENYHRTGVLPEAVAANRQPAAAR